MVCKCILLWKILQFLMWYPYVEENGKCLYCIGLNQKVAIYLELD